LKYQQIAVYGTLKRDKPLSWLLEHKDLVGETVVDGHSLWECHTVFYPIAVPEKGGAIRCEVYKVPNDTFKHIHQIEVNAGYYEKLVQTDLGPCVMWVHAEPPEGWFRVSRHHNGVQEWP
jgi:gamma-glutamylcyclotransferase (GGCT)/AIG2-like uncharacterized protein YtfP